MQEWILIPDHRSRKRDERGSRKKKDLGLSPKSLYDRGGVDRAQTGDLLRDRPNECVSHLILLTFLHMKSRL